MSDISVVAALRFDPNIERVETRREGHRLSDIVAEMVPGASDWQLDQLVVTLISPMGEMVIPRPMWSVVRPRAGTTVRLRMQVAGGSALRAIASIAILVAASFLLGPASPAALGLAGTLGISAQAASSIAIGLATAAGNLLINALIPISQADDKKAEDRYSIVGTRNTANPWGPVPRVLGKLRIYPPYAAGPYTEVVGNDVYLRALFVIGYGPLALSDFRIGETPIDTFQDVQTEIRYGYDTDDPVTLYPEQVIEEQLNNELAQADGWSYRRTATRTEEISIDFSYPNGVVSFKDDGSKDIAWVNTKMGYRFIADDGTPGSWVDLPDLYILTADDQPFRRNVRWSVGTVGKYEIRCKRDTPDTDDAKIYDKVVWSCIRSIRHVYPIASTKPLALLAIRIKATKQLNGTIDQLNCIASSILPDWNGSAWVYQETQNPAAHFRHMLQGNATALPRGDGELDLAAIQEWHEWCTSKGLKYNRYHDFDANLREALAQVAASGRASPSQAGGLWGIVIDRPQTILRGHVTPRNAYQLSGEINYTKLPDAFRVKFLDETDDFKAREIVVPRPGFDGTPTLFEQIEFPGYTSYSLNYREARRRLAELQLRYETWYATQDWEQLFAPRGSLVRFAYPVLSSTLVTARVKAISGSTVILDDIVSMVFGYNYAVRFRLADGTTALWPVTTEPGDTDTITLGSSTDSAPEVGDLAMFGLAGEESVEAVVKSVEPLKDMGARLTLIPHAPTIESIADDGAIPDPPGTGGPPGWAGTAPAVPVVWRIRSGSDEIDPGSTGSPMIVYLMSGGGAAPPDSYVVTAQRGTDAPIVQSVSASVARVVFTGFNAGDVVSVKAHAVSVYSLASADCSPIGYTVLPRTDGPANIATLAYSALSGGIRRFAWTLDPAATPVQIAKIVGYEVRARAGSGWAWSDLAPLRTGLAPASPFDTAKPFASGAHTIGVASVDTFGNYCLHPKVADVTLGTSSATILASRHETTTWPGSLTTGAIRSGSLVGAPSPPIGQLDFSNPDNSAWAAIM